jgi:hypothetical protein
VALPQTESQDDEVLQDLIDDLDEEDVSYIEDANTMNAAAQLAAEELLAYAEELGEHLGYSLEELKSHPEVRSWVSDIRSGTPVD